MEKIVKVYKARLIPESTEVEFIAKDRACFKTEAEALKHEAYLDMREKFDSLKRLELPSVSDREKFVFLKDEEDLRLLLWGNGLYLDEIRALKKTGLHFNSEFVLSKINYPVWVSSCYEDNENGYDYYYLKPIDSLVAELKQFIADIEKVESGGKYYANIFNL